MKSLALMIFDSRDSVHGSSGKTVAIDTKHSIATIPLQRDVAREYARSHDITIGAEEIVEIESDFELDKVVSRIVNNLSSNDEIDSILITNLELFNSTGLASKLISLIGADKLLPVCSS